LREVGQWLVFKFYHKIFNPQRTSILNPINISTSPGIFRWRPACWLRVAGEDAFTFLQGQFTNDLRGLERARAIYGLWLTLKGKVLADSFVLRANSPADFWIGSYFSSAAVIRERLESHIIADDVVIEDVTADWSGASVLGAESLLGETAISVGVKFPGRRGSGIAMECVYPTAGGEPAEISRFTLPVIDYETMELARIAAAIPRIPIDIGPADLPNEAGLENEAISYTKGCYLGQEVMARLKSMGQVRRQLWRVQGCAASLPALPAPVFAGARQVGELRSAATAGLAGWIGLAMVSRMHVAGRAELSFAADGAPALRLDPAA
jgi:folate-binding protein YgfZ